MHGLCLCQRAIALGAAGLGILALCAAPARAVNYFWIGPDGGTFRTPQFWVPFSINPPIFGPGGANDTANFNRGFAPANRYTVNTVFGVNERLLVHNDSLTLVLSDAYSLTGSSSADASFIVGTTAGGTGDVIFTRAGGSGALHSRHNTIGDVAGSSGVVRLVGVDWTIDGILRVGSFGSGSLLIQSGGSVSNVGVGSISGNIGGSAGSNGSVTVTGANSTWTSSGIKNVGVSGTGSMMISGGGKVTNAAGNIGTSSAGEGFVSVVGSGSEWINNGELRVGSGGTGTLNIAFGGRVESTQVGRIALASASSGTATVHGADSRWLNWQTLIIGESGTGTLNIENGGTVGNAVIILTSGIIGANANSTGTVNVTGADSHWNNSGAVRIGQSGTGTLSIAGGGRVSNTGGVVALNAGSSGTVTVSGAGSTWTNSGMVIVAERGDGTLTIEGGGSVSSEPEIGTTAGIVGWLAGSTGTVTVDGDGSTWSNNGSLGIGTVGSGTLTIQNGGTVSASGAGFLGARSGSSGTATITGADSMWSVSANLLVGGDFAAGGGNGILNVQDNAVVSSGAGFIANNDGSTGTVHVEGNAAWTVAGDLTVGGQVNGGGAAALNIQNGGSVAVGTSSGGDIAGNAASQINLDSGGVLEVRGAIDMNGGAFNFLGGTLRAESFAGNLTNQGGTLAPGNADELIGHTAVTSNYVQQATGTLDIEIGGVVPGQFDQVSVAGNASLAGTLTLSLVDGFVPFTGNSFTILQTQFGSISGQFDTVLAPVINGLTFDVVYNPQSVVLQAVQAALLPGDANLDGRVDGEDFLIWQASFGMQSGAAWGDGDFNGDGRVDGEDFLIWQAHFGTVAGGMALAPEPGSLAALMMLLAAGARRRRAKR